MEEIKGILAAHGYEIMRLLGEGNFSKVYLVRHRSGEFYACKISKETEMLRREWEVLSGLSHPAIPCGVAFWEVKDAIVAVGIEAMGNELTGTTKADGMTQTKLAYLIMEYVAGSTVRELLLRREKLSHRCTARVAVELADCLRYLHGEGLLYRDLKPANVILQQDGRVKLLDFGCVCRMGMRPDAKAGTHGFAAPEQLGGKMRLTASCDVYGLGKTMEAMLGAGRRNGRLGRAVQVCIKEEQEIRVPDMYSVIELLVWAAKAGERRNRKARSKRIRARNAGGSSYERDKCSPGQFGKALLQGKLRIYKNVFSKNS